MNIEAHRYTIILKGKESSRSIDKKIKDGEVVNFTKPLTNEKHPKLYIISDKGKIIYVGYTSQPIASRLNSGLKAKGKKGYYGYKWKMKKELELCVFVSKIKFTGNKKHDDDLKLFVEAIEAELVFIVKDKDKQWPECQNEIHFNNYQKQLVGEIAKTLYNIINEKA